MMVGSWHFAYVRQQDVKRGKRTLSVVFYQCPRCSKQIQEASIAQHLLVHEKRAEKSDRTKVFSELGCTTKPAPGQLGFGLLGVSEVLPPPPKKQRKKVAA